MIFYIPSPAKHDQMKKIFVLALCLGLIMGLSAQERSSKFDFKFGAGFGLMGSGDMRTLSLENELNYKINQYFTAAASLGYGKSESGVHEHAAYLMGSLNFFISPFRNNQRNNFRIGGGASFFNHTNFYWTSWNEQDGYTWDFNRTRTTGFNVILEDEQRIGSRLLIGAKLFLTAGVAQGGIVSGAMIKAGVIL